MMFHSQGTARHTCSLLAVTCGNSLQEKYNRDVFEDRLRFPFPELVSSGRLEVKILSNPSKNEICKVIDSYQPNLLYLQGEQLENDEVGSLVLADVDFSSAEAIRDLFRTTLPTTVYLEIPNGDQLAEALHSKGIPYVIYWKNAFSRYTSCHFRNAFLSVVQSSSTRIWDAFQLGLSSFRIYCLRSSHDRSDRLDEELEPHLLGEPSKINVEPPEVEVGENEDGSPPLLPTINIHNDDVTTRFLICGESSKVDESLLGSLEDGLNALLNIEIHGGKLHGKFSAPPPSLQAGTFSRGVVTMRCDLSTNSAAHISLLVSGSAQTCFDDQLLENHIKNEIIENALLVRSILDSDGNKVPLSEPRKSESIACGATVFEVSMKVPSWALQVLRQLAPDVSYRSLVALGIASVQGLPVASFEKEDAERLLFFCSRHEKEIVLDDLNFSNPPSWLKPPVPSRKRCQLSNGEIISLFDSSAYENILPTCKIKEEENQDGSATNGFKTSALPAQQRFRVAALRPIPRSHRHKIMPFSGITESNGQNGGQIKANMPMVPSTKQNTASATQRKTFSNFSQSKQLISLNPLPLKKHGCDRSSIHTCCEENFLKDVMEFLILRGHKRLIPQGGFAEFPEAILNGKRLDLYNLYKEVVTRGGFHVGNGINWKGQIFSKMRNYTMTNRMTGVGNTLKRHYETYLLEYELAHDDVDGECCLLCHSSAAGDWVNCGICGEWAHFGCDRRQGLGAFKDYAKTDGLEYICPHCSVANFKKKSQKIVNGYSQG